MPVGLSAEQVSGVCPAAPTPTSAKLGILAAAGGALVRGEASLCPPGCGSPHEPRVGWPGGSQALQDVREAASALRPPMPAAAPLTPAAHLSLAWWSGRAEGRVASRRRGGVAVPPWPVRLEAVSLPSPAVPTSPCSGGCPARSHRPCLRALWALLRDVCLVFFLFAEMAQGSFGGVFVTSAVSTSNGTRLSAR